MTTIYYVDFEGEAGTGDGTSFANRAKNFEGLGSNTVYLPDGDHEVRVKKSPKKDLGSGSVKRRGGWFRNGYDGPELSSSNSYWEFSTTAGGTGFRYGNHGLETGDWIEIWGNKYYYTDAAYGDGSTSQVMGNLIEINGLWQVTCPDNNWIYLNDYVGHMNSGTGDSWSTRKISNNNNGKWFDVTASTVEFPSNNPLPLKAICSNGQGNRVKWTAATNVTAYDPWEQQSSWSNGTYLAAVGSCDRFSIDNSVSAGTKCAHFELPSTLDLSDYQGVTFEFSWYSGTNTAWQGYSSTYDKGQFSLRLCTDTAGATTAHTIPIDTRYVNKTYGRGHVEWELSTGNLDSAIKSVAIYKDGDVNTTVQFGICNVHAYKTGADRLNHNYKIGLNTTDDPLWYTIKGFDVARNAIRLNTSSGYYNSMRDEYGYYGGGLSCKWSADKTNVNIYSLKSYYPFRDFNGFDGSAFYTNSGSSSESDPGKISWRRFGNGVSASNLKKISGGWDDTNMTSQGATDLTWFDGRYGNQSNSGWRTDSWDNSNQGSHYQHIDSFGFSMSNMYFATKEGKFSNLYVDHPYYMNVSGRDVVGTGFKQISFTAQPSTLISGGTQTKRLESNKAENYITYWGTDGQEQMTFGYGQGVWSKIDFEGIYRCRWQGDSNMTNTDARDNITMDLLKSGMFGREGQQLQFEYTKGLVIKDWQSIYNYMSISTGAEVTIHDMTFDAGTQYTGIHGNYSRASYCINWSSDKVNLLGGTSNRRIYFYKNAKISGFTSTDSEEHYLSGDNLEVMLANQNGVAGAGKYLQSGWYMEPETTIRHTASGKAWKITKTNSSIKPLFKLAKVAVAGSGTVTAKLWVYRVTSGTGSYGILRIPADTTLGLSSKVEMNSTNGAANQWYELSVSANPTSAGIMDIEFQFEDSTSSAYIYFDDMTITQT